MKKWMLVRKSADFEGIGRKYGISPITARVMRNRDVISDEEINMFLNGELKDMHDPFLMKDMEKAVKIVLQSILDCKKIRIVGDYDIDGVCATTILIKSFRAFENAYRKDNNIDKSLVSNISYRLPDRITDGYGINKTMIDEAIADGVEVIVTCDNGIAAFEEIKYAKEKGITVVVTDHHEIPIAEDGTRVLPPADAVVDPHQEDCNYPYENICGGLVAYKLVMGMKSYVNQNVFDFNKSRGDDLLKEDLLGLVDLAAIATIGDIMPLRNENRVIVKHGLERIKRTIIPGLSALIDVTEVNRDRLSAYHIGFIIGPCINAIGRLDSATKALELFLKDSYEEALPIAKELKEANDVRKAMMEEKIREATDIVTNGQDGHDYMSDTVLVIYLENCHESIAGLVASRIKERFYKPVIVLTDAENGAKGSGRSIEEYDMFLELTKVKHLFTKFGGHPMAAGLSMPKENIDEFRVIINQNSKLTEDDLKEKLSIDIDLPINYISKKLVEDLEILGPFGNGNSGPIFAQKDLTILSRRASKNRNMVFFNLKSGPCGDKPEAIIEAKYFGDADEVFSKLGTRDKITIAYSPEINSYRGVDTLQVNIKEWI